MLNDTFNADIESPDSSYMAKQFLTFSYLHSSFVVGKEDGKMFAESCIFASALIWYVNYLVGCCCLIVHLQESLSLKLSCLHFKCNMEKCKYIVVMPQP